MSKIVIINSSSHPVIVKREEVEKYNENHDERGQFSSGDGGSSGDRAWSGSSSGGPKLSKLETGKIGEQVAIDFLKAAGIEDARHLNTDQNNYPVDLAGDHQLIEVKTGLATNSASAMQWRATIGEPGPAEKEWLKSASPSEKAAWNADKSQAIMDRKNAVLDSIGKQTGMKLKGTTVGIILNPSTKKADVYVFEGFHSRIAWKSPLAAKAYKGTVSYG